MIRMAGKSPVLGPTRSSWFDGEDVVYGAANILVSKTGLIEGGLGGKPELF